MNVNESSHAVSPVVGVILVVVITVALSGVVGVFVFDLGQFVSDSSTSGDIATRTTYNADGTATVQVVTGEADELRVLVNGTEANNLTNPTPGQTVRVTATSDSSITILATQNGDTTVLSSLGNSTGPRPITVPTDGLIAHWELSENATDSVGSYDGTVNGATFVTEDERQTAVFDGTDYISIPDVTPTNELTISFWVKSTTDIDGANTVDSLVYLNTDLNAGYLSGLWIDDYNGIRFGYATGASSSNSLVHNIALNDGRWHHITSIKSNTGMSIYVDGELAKSNSQVGTIRHDTDSTTFGAWNNDGVLDKHYTGKLADVRIYNRALTSEEIADLYNATK